MSMVQYNPAEQTDLPAAQDRGLIDVETGRAIQQVQAALAIAKRFPRDEMAAYYRTMKAFERTSLAEKALYSYPRGGQSVTGPSIRMAEVLARNWGNVECGVRELERKDGKSVAEAFCWDLETNFKEVKIFEVAHRRDTKGGGKILTDERDIYEIVANMGSRRKRACILSVIPIDFVEDAIDVVKKTLAKGSGNGSLDQRIKKVVMAFKALGVTPEMLEKRLGHPMAETIPDEFVELQGIFNALKDKTAKREDYFELTKKLDDIMPKSETEANKP